MERFETSIPGVYEIRPAVLEDARGFFMETYHRQKFQSLGIEGCFVQDNHSRSTKGTLRGLHDQLRHPQAKVCRVVEGEALDVAVDIRVGSPTFGRWSGVTLSSRTHNMIYFPAGFAHGFLALSDSVELLYKCSDFYDRDDEHGIRWNDPSLGISWGTSAPLVSDKDARLPCLADVPRELLPRFDAK